MLGDLGADILKVEAPWARGKATPQAANPMVGDAEDHWNHQGITLKLNRNKRGLCIDAKHPDGHATLLALAAEVDVIVNNFTATAMASMGLDYAAVKTINPNVIYVSMPGFGMSGPNSDFVAYGPAVEPMCGLTAVMGYSPDEPRVTAYGLPDACAGTTAAAAVVTALHHRDETGRGGHIELALQEAAMALVGEYFILAQIGDIPERMGNAHGVYAPHGLYPCIGEDEWIAIATRDDDEWLSLCLAAGLGWHKQPSFRTEADRRDNRETLDAAIGEWTRTQDKLVLTQHLQASRVPAGAVMVAPDLLQDAQLLEREYLVSLGCEDIPAKPYPGTPVRIDGEHGADWTRAPKLGEHNREILKKVLGYDDARVDALEAEGVITTRPPAP